MKQRDDDIEASARYSNKGHGGKPLTNEAILTDLSPPMIGFATMLNIVLIRLTLQACKHFVKQCLSSS